MIPIRDANPTSRNPYITYALIALNVAAFVLWQQGPLWGEPSPRQVEIWFCFGSIPSELTTFEVAPILQNACPDKSIPLSLFTSMFLHANLFHIGGNMLFLWVFGNNVEDRMGHGVYLLFYLASGIAATYGQVLVSPDDMIPQIGASGAIAGVLGAYLVMFPHARVLTLVMFFVITVIELPALVVLGLWFVFQAFSGLGSLTGPAGEGGVAFFAHIGGFVFGVLVALIFYRRRRAPPVPDWYR